MPTETLLERLAPSLQALRINPDNSVGKDGQHVPPAGLHGDDDITQHDDGIKAGHTSLLEQTQPTDREDEALSRLSHVRELVLEGPYNIAHRLELSDLYAVLGYPDLAAGEAYKALLLVDEVSDESGEYHEVAWEALREALSHHSLAVNHDNSPSPNNGGRPDDACSNSTDAFAGDENLARATTAFSEASYEKLIHNLFQCGCMRSATEMCVRMLQKHPNRLHGETCQQVLNTFCDWCDQEQIPLDLEKAVEEAPEAGTVRRELYNWNQHEPDRFSNEALELLNIWMAEVASKLEVRATDLPMLADSTQTYVTSPRTYLLLFIHHFISPREI